MRFALIASLVLVSVMPTLVFSGTQQDAKEWNKLYFYGHLKKDTPYIYSIDADLRFGQLNQPMEQGLTRLGLGYQYSNDTSVLFGYARVATAVDDSNQRFDKENRFWSDLNWRLLNNDQISLKSRTRFEARHLLGYSQEAYRLRQRLMVNFHKKLFKGATAQVFDEVFFNINKPNWVDDRTVDRNRLFMGLKFHLTNATKLKLGYINQYAFRSPDNRMDHILDIACTVNMD